MPWPTEVPVFDESMIAQKAFSVDGLDHDCHCASRWLHRLFGVHTAEWLTAIRYLASLCSNDDTFYDVEETGEMCTLILWNESNSKKRIAYVLNKLMAKLGYTEDV